MLLAVGALLLGLFVANVYVLTGVRMNIENRLPGGAMLSGWTHFLFTAATNALLFAVIYKILPKVAVRWRDALAGGLLVSLVWILGQHLLVRFLIGPELHGLRRRGLVHRGDDLGLLCQRHPLSRRRVRRGPLDRSGPKQETAEVIAPHL